MAPWPLGCPLRPRPPRAAAAPLTQAPVGFERFIGIKLKSVPNCLKCNQNKAGLNQKLEQALSKPQQPETSPRGAPGTDPPPCARTRPRGHPQPLPALGNNTQKLQPWGGGAAPTGGLGIPPFTPPAAPAGAYGTKAPSPPVLGGVPSVPWGAGGRGGLRGGPAPARTPRITPCGPPLQRGAGLLLLLLVPAAFFLPPPGAARRRGRGGRG